MLSWCSGARGDCLRHVCGATAAASQHWRTAGDGVSAGAAESDPLAGGGCWPALATSPQISGSERLYHLTARAGIHTSSAAHARRFQTVLQKYSPKSKLYTRENYEAYKASGWDPEVGYALLAAAKPKKVAPRLRSQHIMEAPTLQDLKGLLQAHAAMPMAPHQLAAAITRVPKLMNTKHGTLDVLGAAKLLSKLVPRLEAVLPDIGVRELANCLWAMGRADYRPKHVLQTLLDRLAADGGKLLEQAEPAHLCMLATALPLLQTPADHVLWRLLADRVQQGCDEFEGAALSGVAMGLSRCPSVANDRALWERLQAAAVQRVAQMKPREVVSVAHAFASLRMPFPLWWGALDAHLTDRELWPYSSGHLAQLLRSMSVVWRRAPKAVSAKLVDRACTLSALKLRHSSARDIATVLWAAAETECKHQRLFREGQARLIVVHGVSAQYAAMALLACARMELLKPEFVEWAASTLPKQLPGSSPATLATLLQALVAAQHESGLVTALLPPARDSVLKAAASAAADPSYTATSMWCLLKLGEREAAPLADLAASLAKQRLPRRWYVGGVQQQLRTAGLTHIADSLLSAMVAQGTSSEPGVAGVGPLRYVDMPLGPEAELADHGTAQQ